MSPLVLALSGWGIMIVVMALLWFYQYKGGDAGIVDVAWAAGVGILSVYFALLSDGDLQRRYIVAILAGIWALRLSGHIFYRVLKMPEDGRYQELKKNKGDGSQKWLFKFFQLQAFWAMLFALPMLNVALNPNPLGVTDWIGIGIWLFASLGESIADGQLNRFRLNPENQGNVCRNGLWYYSRHPNYFFEWIHWWGYVLLAFGAPMWWLNLLGPICMLWFLTNVTGVPPTERQALRSRGAAYEEYQRTTNAFFPWPPKADTTD